MLSRGTILTVALRITAVSSMAELSFENWFCGTDTMTRMISYNSMYLDAGGSLNHCCAIHDNCYGLQLGRENCDQNFCDCLRRLQTAVQQTNLQALSCFAFIPLPTQRSTQCSNLTVTYQPFPSFTLFPKEPFYLSTCISTFR
ncbi:unnamed protein product [Haemonchus placei]|uniref:Phospholipase A2 n=1 Tax=Haemonchus placei TaxID=6290 RepID=A0A0N4WMH6_HAEPC|nr:unnamed protein product [Haemonchus placei]